MSSEETRKDHPEEAGPSQGSRKRHHSETGTPPAAKRLWIEDQQVLLSVEQIASFTNDDIEIPLHVHPIIRDLSLSDQVQCLYEYFTRVERKQAKLARIALDKVPWSINAITAEGEIRIQKPKSSFITQSQVAGGSYIDADAFDEDMKMSSSSCSGIKSCWSQRNEVSVSPPIMLEGYFEEVPTSPEKGASDHGGPSLPMSTEDDHKQVEQSLPMEKRRRSTCSSSSDEEFKTNVKFKKLSVLTFDPDKIQIPEAAKCPMCGLNFPIKVFLRHAAVCSVAFASTYRLYGEGPSTSSAHQGKK